MENKRWIEDLQYNLLKAQTNYEVLREWIYTSQVGHPVKNFFLKNNYKAVAVYGMGEIGLLLCNELLECPGIEIKYAIDQNVKSIPFDIPITNAYLPDKAVDVIVVTPYFAFGEIKGILNAAGINNVVSIKEVIVRA